MILHRSALHRAALFGILTTCLVPGLPGLAGAWTPEKGRTYLKLSGNLFRSSANFDLDGNRFDPFAAFDDRYMRFRDENASLYFETGLTGRLALFGSLTYKEVSQTVQVPQLHLTVRNNGWADMDLGARYRFTDGPNVWSAAFTAKLPYLYDADDAFPLGNGQEDLEVRVLYGRGLKHGFYAGLEAAYRFRLEEPGDETRYLAEGGWSGRRVYARAKVDLIRSVDTLGAGPNGTNPLLNPRYDLDTLALTGGWTVRRGLQVEYTYTDTQAGKNTADGHNHQLALVVLF